MGCFTSKPDIAEEKPSHKPAAGAEKKDGANYQTPVKDQAANGTKAAPKQATETTAKEEPAKSPAAKPVAAPEPAKSQPAKSAPKEPGSVRDILIDELKLQSQQVIDAEQALVQSSGDYAFLIELMQTFRNQYRSQKNEIVKGYETQDWDQMALESHSMKGAAANLFIQQMRAACIYLEGQGKSFRDRCEKGEVIPEDQIARVGVAIEVLEQTFGAFEEALDKIIANAPAE